MSELLEMILRVDMLWLFYFCLALALFTPLMFWWSITRWLTLGLWLIVVAYVVAYVVSFVIKAQMGEEQLAAYCHGTKPGDPAEQAAQRAIDMDLLVRRYEAEQRWVKPTITRLDVVDGQSSCELEHDGAVWRSRLHEAPGGGSQQLASYCEETKPDEPVELTLQRAIDSKLRVARIDRKLLVKENQDSGWQEERDSAYFRVTKDGGVLGRCVVEHDGEHVTKVNFFQREW